MLPHCSQCCRTGVFSAASVEREARATPMPGISFQELLVNTVLLPVINLVSDPDYINQTIVWMCRNNMPTSDDFLTVLRCTDNLNELEAVQEIVAQEIAVQRSRDSGGDDDTVIKKQLNSLLYLKKVVENRLQRLNDGSLDTDSTGLPSQFDLKKLSAPGVELFQLPFDVVLANNIALSYFIDFMTSIGAQKYISFYLHAEDDCSSLYSLDQEEEPIEFLNKDLPTVPPEPIENVKASEAFLTANIYNTGIVREGSTSFALYAISVCRREPLTPEERWCVFRRYSDFDDFHILILEKDRDPHY
ncbi:sorting nexin-13 [Ixodes scapularis]